nr:DUF3737 family protein [Eggerthella sinensis]
MDETTARKALGLPRERGGNRETVRDETFAEPRAVRQARALDLVGCRFEGGEEAAGALGSCVDVAARGCRFRSPRAFAGARLAVLRDCRFAGTSRAPLWHGAYLDLTDCDIAGNSALRGCAEVSLEGCDVVSDEFGWECDRVRLANSSVRGDRALLLSTHLKLEGVRLMGPRALQGVRDVVIERCEMRRSIMPAASSFATACCAGRASDGTLATCGSSAAPSSGTSRFRKRRAS